MNVEQVAIPNHGMTMATIIFGIIGTNSVSEMGMVTVLETMATVSEIMATISTTTGAATSVATISVETISAMTASVITMATIMGAEAEAAVVMVTEEAV